MFGRRDTNQSVRATERDGVQEVSVLVQGGYRPDKIIAAQGKPVRLLFRREESSPCSEEVVFEHFGARARLPQGRDVWLELPASEPGEYAFSCGHGMLHGTLVVE